MALCAAVVLSLTAGTALALPGDEFWDGRFELPGFDGTSVPSVFAVLIDGTNVYAAGHFMDNNGTPMANVGRWDGSQWTALGNGLGADVNFVYALAMSGTNLYAGGDFVTSGSTAVNHIARWDGQNWVAVGGGTDDTVYAIGVNGTNLYAGGSFRHAGGISASGVARWNGTSWSALSDGVAQGVNTAVYALAFQGTDVIAGGTFSTAGSVSVARLARWDGTNWSGIANGVSGAAGSTAVFALLVDGADLYVGGQFVSAGGNPASGIARYNAGSGWFTFSGGIHGAQEIVRTIALIGADVYAGGSFDRANGTLANCIAKWDGATWQALGSGADDFVYAMKPRGADLYLGGGFYHAGGKDSTLFGIYSTPTRLDGLAAVATFTLTWRVSAFNYTLQYSTNLANSVFWTDLGAAPAVVGTNYVVVDVMNAPYKFYRLYKP